MGERLIALTDHPRAKIAAALTLLSPFIPMLFQGEEWAASTPFQYFTDHEDKELGRLVSEGRKKEFAAFGWDPAEIPDPQAASTFQASKLQWSELQKPQHAHMLQWYKDLIRLRKTHRELTDGALEQVNVEFDEEDQWFTMQRGSIVVVFTLAEEGYSASLEENVRILLSSDTSIHANEGFLVMPCPGVAILEVS
jgi:maltooligosyltrehalose trehalohydrolase